MCVCEHDIDSKIIYLAASVLHIRLGIKVHQHLQTNVTDIYYANFHMSVQMIDGQTNVQEILLTVSRVHGVCCGR